MNRYSGSLVSLTFLLLCGLLSHPVEGQTVPDAPSSLDVPVTIPLESYAGTDLRKLKVVIAGDTLDFLIDTGGGVTLISPALAEALGCTPGGRVHGYRMSGDEIEWKTCTDVPLGMGDFRTTVEAGVFDLMPLIGSKAPVVHGMISLQTFAGHSVTLHAGGTGLTVETPESLEERVRGATPLRVRLATGLEGAELTAYIGIPGKDADYWLLWDSGNNGPTHIAEWAAAALGIPDTAGAVEFPLPLAPGLEMAVPVRRRQIIHDGVLSAGLISRATWTIDLEQGRMWVDPVAQHVPAGREAVEAAFARLDSTLARQGANSGSMSLRRLEDSTALLMLPLIRDMVGQLPDDVCGVLFTDPQAYTHDRFIDLLAQADTRIVNRWVTLLEQSALANIQGLPEHPRPPQSAATAVIQRALKSQSPEELRRLMTAMNSQDSADQCRAARKLAGLLNALPDQDKIRLMRSNFP